MKAIEDRYCYISTTFPNKLFFELFLFSRPLYQSANGEQQHMLLI